MDRAGLDRDPRIIFGHEGRRATGGLMPEPDTSAGQDQLALTTLDNAYIENRGRSTGLAQLGDETIGIAIAAAQWRHTAASPQFRDLPHPDLALTAKLNPLKHTAAITRIAGQELTNTHNNNTPPTRSQRLAQPQGAEKPLDDRARAIRQSASIAITGSPASLWRFHIRA